MASIEVFKKHILKAGVIDADQVHHEFAYGDHGQKIDFGLIPNNSPLFDEWVEVNAQTITAVYPRLPSAVVGVANGTNWLSRRVAKQLGITALFTRKLSSKEVALTNRSARIVSRLSGLIVVLEDIGTSGGTALTAVNSILSVGNNEAEVLFTWRRTDQLVAMTTSGTRHHSIIEHPLATYSPEECKAVGFCADNWQLIPHPSSRSQIT